VVHGFGTVGLHCGAGAMPGASGRRQRVQQKTQIVNQGIKRAERRPDGGLAVAERIPGERDARREKMLRIILSERRIAGDHVGLENAARVM
jgi:hypothetical protein